MVSCCECTPRVYGAVPLQPQLLPLLHQPSMSAAVQPAPSLRAPLQPPRSGALQPRHFLHPRTPGPCGQPLPLSAAAQAADGALAGPLLQLSGG
jgi:hypothetical protein